jgi:hypothetical protein
MKRLKKEPAKERRAKIEAEREAKRRKKWRLAKAAQRRATADLKPETSEPVPETQTEVTAVRDSAELGADGLGYVYEDSMGNRYERDSLGSAFKRVGDVGSAAVPALTLEQRAARREERSNGLGTQAQPNNAINMRALFAVRHLSR